MRQRVIGLVGIGCGVSASATAVAAPTERPPPPGEVQAIGDVARTAGRWTADGSRIVTDVVIRQDDGTEVTVSQLGGHADGLTMQIVDGAPLMRPGMRVAIAGHAATSPRRGATVVVDAVEVRRWPERTGFVRTGPTLGGHMLWWESTPVSMVAAAEGTSALAADTEFAVVAASYAAWNGAPDSCPLAADAPLVDAGRVELEVGRDEVNLIKFRDTSWCRPATADDPERCYEPLVVAKTTIVFIDDADHPRDGAIVDADIEINGVFFAIASDGASLGLSGCRIDLASSLTHELGHLLGLEHTCTYGDDPPRVDGRGAPVPACDATTDPQIVEATMYPYLNCDETHQASLTTDDRDAICAVYPDDLAARGCQAAGTTAAPVGLAVVTLLGLRRRRRTAT